MFQAHGFVLIQMKKMGKAVLPVTFAIQVLQIFLLKTKMAMLMLRSNQLHQKKSSYAKSRWKLAQSIQLAATANFKLNTNEEKALLKRGLFFCLKSKSGHNIIAFNTCRSGKLEGITRAKANQFSSEGRKYRDNKN